MTSHEIRKAFLDFFRSRQHEIVPSVPIVVKNDPTLMFTNAGMNQFKDIFLGNIPAKFTRIADTQKCLRVSGKHNDLEEVGIDTYHHTMFEMLGNWSFGDYFKKEGIAWAWELLTDIYRLPKDRLYVTVFEGDKKENLAFDQEAYDFWKSWIDEARILKGNKKDNFWEMGDTGPCGPCSEVHIDLRPEADRKKTDGKLLVNTGHPQVIEIWNLVFIEFNRKANGSLEKLPAQHVDTGMGFERLCMAMQGKTSNYDTDIFQPTIQYIAKECGKKYGEDEKADVAMRVLSDHIRAVAFTIADGQLPSNTGAGYVIRRILRRAVRYGYTFLGFKEPFLTKLVPIISTQFSDVFPELDAQRDFVAKVIHEEEAAFLRTLATGMQRFENYIRSASSKKVDGEFSFELYDTYGFPIDLTQLIAREAGLEVDMDGFNRCMEAQKTRSRNAAAMDTGDWTVVSKEEEPVFLGYETTSAEVRLVKYRKVKSKGKEQYQLVFDQTPFYAESGGQVGDKGYLAAGNEKIFITDTQKENTLIVHLANALPSDTGKSFFAQVDVSRRKLTENNHSATHLLHAALKQVLGNHVAQKGSLVNDEYLRFDFSHFAKMTSEEIAQVEAIVNRKIRENIFLDERRNVPFDEAKKSGATALFGEKYGDFVRVITFDKAFSVELCGGTHVRATGQIGLCKIVSESAIAAGVRRIEAVTADRAEAYINAQLAILHEAGELLKNPKDLTKAIQALLDEYARQHEKIKHLLNEKAQTLKAALVKNMKKAGDINCVFEKIDLPSSEAVKTLCYEMKAQIGNLFMVLGSESDGKAQLSVMISENLVKDRGLDAAKIVRELAKDIDGGGGGQSFYATAGGKKIEGLDHALRHAEKYV